MYVSEKELSQLKEMIFKNLQTLYERDPGRFESDMQGFEQGSKYGVNDTIHTTINTWFESLVL